MPSISSTAGDGLIRAGCVGQGRGFGHSLRGGLGVDLCDGRLPAGPDGPLRRYGGLCFRSSPCFPADYYFFVTGYNLVIIHMWRHSCP